MQSASLIKTLFRATTRCRHVTRGFATGGTTLAQLTKANPYQDVVHYTHKNRTWSMEHVDYYTTALAIGILENGFQQGDVVLSWLPEHFSEQVRTTGIGCLYRSLDCDT